VDDVQTTRLARAIPLATLAAALGVLALPAAASAGTVSASPPASSFNTQPYYFGGQFNNFLITNTGSDTTFGAASITGPDAARFSVGGDGCQGNTFGDGQFCNVGAVFNPPNGAGTFNAQLEIPSNGSPDPLVIPLSATALAGPRIAASPARVDFGPTVLGEASRQVVTITNVGDFTGGVQQAAILGPADFEIEDDNCTQVPMSPGQSCTMTVVFAPLGAGEASGAVLTIPGTPTQSVLLINLSGEGREAAREPETELRQSPPRRTRNRTAGFQFTSTTAGATFECSLDGAPYASCTSPATYRVRRGRHSVAVRAVDADGNVDSTPATATWRVRKPRRR
jgi:hypothetical protein